MFFQIHGSHGGNTVRAFIFSKIISLRFDQDTL